MESTLKREHQHAVRKSELFITILASVAQGESENISSNNRWAIQKRFQDGTYIISTPAYGYGKDEDGNLVIIESEAETVRWIYESYLNGMGVYVIAKALNQKGIPTIRGAEKWQDGVIQDILKIRFMREICYSREPIQKQGSHLSAG